MYNGSILINNVLNFNEVLICLFLKVNIVLIIFKIVIICGIVMFGYCGICKKVLRFVIILYINVIYRNCFKLFIFKLLLYYYI